ncbi:MAG: CDGSH iron-sulfur domain-containing protein [bacterium]
MCPIQIVIGDNGPIRVLGDDIVIKDMSGKTYDIAGRTKVSLCRCGLSRNKPFCDGEHKGGGFESKCEAFALPPPAPPAPRP